MVVATVESVEVVARVREEGARSRQAREVTGPLCRERVESREWLPPSSTWQWRVHLSIQQADTAEMLTLQR